MTQNAVVCTYVLIKQTTYNSLHHDIRDEKILQLYSRTTQMKHYH